MTVRTGVLKHSPLTHVIASVRFAPWPLLAKQIDQIHDQLREFVPHINNIKMEQLGPDGQAIGMAHEAWMLMSLEKDFGIQFAPDQILFYTSSYTSYENFSVALENALNLLVKHMRFIDVTNMGIRFIDHVKPKNGESITQYVTEKLMPPRFDGMETKGGHLLSEYLIDNKRLRVNAISMPGSLPMPQELIGLLLMAQGQNNQLQIEALNPNELILDVDAICTYDSAKRMHSEEVLKELKILHSLANNFFRKNEVFTDFAFSTWRGEN